MYKAFFGFTERPFKLVPSPDFYFLSKSHEEAMAHLSYAVSQGDGFVAITGEVGAGKTTLCRTFLDQLDDTVEVAYILNPGDSALQLIKSICQEFGLAVDGSDMHALINRLNPFLLASRRAGKTVLVLIDEAQHLRQSVLEQLRLLSNLETAHDKLLQIILVGQPELMTALQTHALRQLRQRISLTCRLMPFTLAETRQYISHRINRVAGHLPGPVFSKLAVRRIHRYSGGTPRLINIVCDRALLIAFGGNQKRIGANIARRAVAELSAGGAPAALLKRWMLVGVALGLAVVGVVWWGIDKSVEWAGRPGPDAPGPGVAPSSLPSPAEAKADPVIPVASAQTVAALPPDTGAAASILSHAQLGELLDRHDDRFTRRAAVDAVLSRWPRDATPTTDLTFIKDDGLFFRQVARQAGMRMQRLEQGLDLLEIIDLPAILQLWSPTALHQVYVGWVGRNQDQVTLAAGETRMHTTRDVLAALFSGAAYVPWKNIYGYQGVMGVDAPGESVLALKLQLMQMGLGPFALTDAYDRQTRQAVTRLQQRWGLDPDGFAGPITQMVLYGRCGSVDVPRLNLSLPTGADRSE